MKEPAVEAAPLPVSLLGFPQYAFQLTIFMWPLVLFCHLLLNKLSLQRSQKGQFNGISPPRVWLIETQSQLIP